MVPKANGKIRTCVDFTKLNESVCRELHMLPCVEQILTQLSGAKLFSKLDQTLAFGKSSFQSHRPTYNFHNSIREILLSKTSIWDHFCTRDIPEVND